ncbi:MAG: hypothetical protein M3Y66_07345, partial [Actinomycetota bacterium]|nr:hypothetical protein [Actinomycetota bacterium]
MGIFRRNRPATGAGQPADFWHWWGDTGAALTAHALARHEPTRAAHDISRAVHAMDPELSWELAAGDVSQ